MQERRNFVRAKRVLSIEYRLLKRHSKKVAGEWKLSTTQDMSVGGLALYSEVEFRKNDVLELKVLMSGVLEIFNGRGKVVRVEKKRNASFFMTAVQFLKNDVKSRRAKSYTTSSAKSKNK